MRIRTALLAMVSVLAFGMAGTHEAHAASVSFNFAGTCQNGTAPSGNQGLPASGCEAFGLSEGDLVSGSLTLDMDLVAGDTTINVFDDPTAAFEFTFGNESHDLGDFADVGDFQVTFDADATQLVCVSGAGLCPGADFADFNNGTAGLRVRSDSVTGIKSAPTSDDGTLQLTGTSPPIAHALGNWTRAVGANPIPEPSAALMFGVGALVVRAGRRRVA